MIYDRLGSPIRYGSLLLFPGVSGLYLVVDVPVCRSLGGGYCDLKFRTIEKPVYWPPVRAFSSRLGGYSLTIRYDLGTRLTWEVLYDLR